MPRIFKHIYVKNIIAAWQYISGFILYIIIDQISKTFLIYYLNNLPYKIKNISDNFDLVYVWNYGISFGLFSNHKLGSFIFFIINSIITTYLILIRFSAKNKLEDAAYCLIIGGAIGNLFDRIARGAVFDFIYLHYDKYNFPIFNGADMFISLGVALLLYSSFSKKPLSK
jgi:signal peptidase II